MRSYVEAGFTKIHLDASMACAGDPDPLPPELIAAPGRPAVPVAAEAAGGRPVYVIGTEVPVPGGAHEAIDQLEVTRTEDLAAHDRAAPGRLRRGRAGRRPGRGCWRWWCSPASSSAAPRWSTSCPSAPGRWPTAIEREPGLVFEAHSTDYQTEAALRALVERHFAILKVGPGLTFALREALFALAAIEAELLPAERALAAARRPWTRPCWPTRGTGRATITARRASSASPAPSA